MVISFFFSGEDVNLSNFSLNLVGSSESGGKIGLYELQDLLLSKGHEIFSLLGLGGWGEVVEEE